MSRQAALWILILIIVGGIALRSWELTARSLWFDEAFSWRLIQFPFTEMLDRAAADVHPPLYYVILRGWATVFGTSLLSLRSFSVAMAGVTTAVAYGFTVYASGSRRAGLLAAALIAASGWLATFAWEARMYTLGTALAIASTWLLLRGVRRPAALTWISYGLVAAAFAYTHYFAFFTLAGHALFVLGALVVHTRWRVGEMLQAPLFWMALAGAALAAVLYIPWVPVLLAQNAQVQEAYWVPEIGGWSIPDTFYRMIVATTGIPPHTWPVLILAVLPIAGTIIMWFLLAFAPRRRDASMLVLLAGLIPFLLAIGISYVGQSLYQDRFLVFTSVFLWIGLALLFEYIPRKWQIAASIAVPALALVGAVHLWLDLDIPSKPGAMASAAYIQEQLQDGQPVVVTSPFIFFSIDHYLQESYGRANLARLYSETGEFLHFAGGPILTQEDLIDPSVFASRNTDTMWLVDTSGFGGSKLAIPSPWRVAEEMSYPEVFVHQGEVFVRKLVR